MSAIQQYLKDFRKTLPQHLRAEAEAEIRTHLEELTQEWQRRGLTRPEAETKAIQAFGLPRKIGNAWRQAAGVVDWPDILLAALPILGISGLGRYFVGQYIPVSIFLVIFGLGAVVAWRQSWPTWWYAWLGWLFLALLVLPGTHWVFFVSFPLLVTILAVESWQHATLMTLPFTTYLAFKTLIGRQQLVTTGWGPGNIYPGNIVWLETAFSILWILVLAASLRAARPSRRGIYLLAGLIGTQLIYIGGVMLMILVGKSLPAYFITTLTTKIVLLHKLPLGLLTIGLTLYPLLVWLVARWLQRNQTQSGLPA
ncbi:MAG: hypothetical protein JW953_07955 [Anaerolineae bacterium]|nr:hypothetical protein [Anaerolineae bacterium]